MSFLKDFRVLLLAIWLGAALFFSAVVAPTAFSVLRGSQVPNANELAGGIVNRALTVVNTGGFIVGLVLLVTGLLLKRNRLWIFELFSLGVMVIATGVAQWIIAAKLHSLRASMVLAVDQIPIADPRRVAFNNLHGYSVTALAIAMIAALIAFFVITHRARLN
ncbi:MAG TPA: DUF4149 domain-containing protein [Pyrinomonadaceae bacterium]|nr:DUF4149 domain-containing protein [Pyrinomonadaceae bacterium]